MQQQTSNPKLDTPARETIPDEMPYCCLSLSLWPIREQRKESVCWHPCLCGPLDGCPKQTHALPRCTALSWNRWWLACLLCSSFSREQRSDSQLKAGVPSRPEPGAGGWRRPTFSTRSRCPSRCRTRCPSPTQSRTPRWPPGGPGWRPRRGAGPPSPPASA